MTLSSLASPSPARTRNLLHSRMIGRALAPHWPALLALALFLVAGLAVLDDYGVTDDEFHSRGIVQTNLRFLANDDIAAFIRGFHIDRTADKFYGIAFEAPLFLTDRAFALDDGRAIIVSRHLLSRVVYLVGGLFAYLLAYRLFRSRLLAVAALLLLLLHPRLYAHSFFNSKDIPFLVAFIIALYLAHRAFKKDTLLSFALLGVGVGVAVNLRIIGVVLLAVVPALRALDLAFAPSRRERKRVLLSTGAFVLMSLLTIYALLPYLWADPLGRAVEWWTTLSDHPYEPDQLFRGLHRRTAGIPEYIPVWFSITSPPFALLLGLVGTVAVLLGAVRSPRIAIRSGRLRFGLLLIGCVAAPVAAVILLNANIYDGWRQMHFAWAPFSLIGMFGMAALTRALARSRLRAAVYGAAVVGVAATALSTTLIHPNQQAYFNALVDRVTPERLRTQYEMDYWHHPRLQTLEWLSNNADLLPGKAAITGGSNWEDHNNSIFLPDAARARIDGKRGFKIVQLIPWESWGVVRHALYRTQVYNNTLFFVEPKDDLQAVYAATQGRESAAAVAFDVYELDEATALVMEPCAPAFIKVSVVLRATPVDQSDLPPWRKGKREEPRIFPLREYGAFFDGKCVASLPLPDYPIADFRLVWRPELLDREVAREAMRGAQEEGRLLARSVYDLYLADNELVYVQEGCDPLETEHPFRVSVFPDRASDLPEEWRERGHERFWFEFYEYGALLEEGACVAFFPLPDYPVAGIRTAQYIEGGDDLWEAAFSANPGPYAAAYRSVAGSAPVAQGAFDLYLLDGDVVYVKESCEPADTEARFFLHIVPERAGDLPDERRELGFDNLDFRFFLSGAWFGGQCAARVPLPDYPVASVRTGQYVSGAGEIWSAEFAAGG